MGLLLNWDMVTVPAQCTDNDFMYWLGDEVVHCKIEGTKNLHFKKQCRHFKLPRVTCFLEGDEFNLVLRNDGTGTVYTQDGKYMRNTVFHEISPFQEFQSGIGGSMYFKSTSIDMCAVVDLIHLHDDWYLLSNTNVPVSVVISKTENPEYFRDIRDNPYAVVTRVAQDGIYRLGTDGRDVFKMKGEVYYDASFRMLGGVTWRG